MHYPAPHHHPPYRPSESGTVLRALAWVAMCSAVALWVLGMLAFFVSGPAAFAVAFGLALLPVPVVVAALMWVDRVEPEPGKYLLAAFAWGATVSVGIALAFGLLLDPLFTGDQSAYLGAPVVEEAAKGLFLLILLWYRPAEFDGVVDGIVYAGFVAAGFAFTENILYIAGAYEMGAAGGEGALPLLEGGVDDAVLLFVLRCVFSPFAHPLFTVMTGVGLGVAATTRHGALKVLAPLGGWAAAVALHGIWNYSALQGNLSVYFLVMVPLFLVMAGFAVFSRRQELTVLRQHLPAYAATGWIADWELPALVTLRGRRAARVWARQRYGKPGVRAMRDLQLAATELAFLHRKAAAGTGLRLFARRQQELLGVLSDRKRMLAPAAAAHPFGVVRAGPYAGPTPPRAPGW